MPTDYANDHIWEIKAGEGDPPALAVRTTYGLRARSMRLFPRFIDADGDVTDPACFPTPPTLEAFYPNYLRLHFSPLWGIDATAEVWVPDSQAVAGRFLFTNRDEKARRFTFEWIAQLSPTQGQRMAPTGIQNVHVLTGKTGDLSPVVFITGGPQGGSGLFPALRMDIQLRPEENRRLTWSQVARPSTETSFNHARAVCARSWEAEVTRIEMANNGLVEVFCGDPEWDFAFALSQSIAHRLMMSPTARLENASYVLARSPDQGYSLRGDGGDYGTLWSGQTPFESYYLLGLILPEGRAHAKGILRNYLKLQEAEGIIDWKPGLAGQRGRLLATPMLAAAAWRIYQSGGDLDFLKACYTPLTAFFKSWFTPAHDRDRDGIPEWDHPLQSGFEDHPLFSNWHDWSYGADISTAESPSLCAMLFSEAQALLKIAKLIDVSDGCAEIQTRLEALKDRLEQCWDSNLASYVYWDRDSHRSDPAELLGVRTGSGRIELHTAFPSPVRLLINIRSHGETTIRPQIVVQGTSTSGLHRVEQIPNDQVRWSNGRGFVTGARLYQEVEAVETHGLGVQDEVSVYRIGFRNLDHTTLLPLWAGAADPERARQLVEMITNPNLYWRPYGIPALPGGGSISAALPGESVHLPWNALIGEGLLRYGYQRESAQLLMAVMAAITRSLKETGAFYKHYHAGHGAGSGERNILNGLTPLGWFLDTLGVRLISNERVGLRGFNPFPWPITVKYKGMSILRQAERTSVTFADGQSITVEDPAACIVSLAE
ncbi:MAG: hypothetical protein PHD58_04550 [Anaerolineales bacterium]|nr:hypothetical protein [Anaerolineales bacterium]